MTAADLPANVLQPDEAEGLGPWNPGVKSWIPRRLAPLTTLYRPENVCAGLERVAELQDITGLEPWELVLFRPGRLALHELLIRVTGELSVPDGARYEDLGINFRAMVGVILERDVQPRMAELTAAYEDARRRLKSAIDAELKLFSRDDHRADAWEDKGRSGDGAEAAACAALARVVRALYCRHGHAWGTTELIGNLALDLASNTYGSDEIGRLIGPLVRAAAEREGYRLLPPQAEPMVLNTKGPSASGKSTLRPLQRVMARRLNVDWRDFALISTDIWRKQLLDYSSLGPDFRYGAMLTSDELAIVDRKFDRYMERKAAQGRTPHMLLDRFRFGDFAPAFEKPGQLLSRFGRCVHFFFMLVPPEALVERAWTRALEVGRYKAVDDTLAHSVEAYGGIPRLFLSWVTQNERPVFYEFLDNSVRKGALPRTAAFGSNGRMFVLDVATLLDVRRFRRVNVDAGGPWDLYARVASGDLAPERNADFLVECVRKLDEVVFADRSSGRVWLCMRRGAPAWGDAAEMARAAADPVVRAALAAIGPDLLQRTWTEPGTHQINDLMTPAERVRSLGAWGEAA